MKSFRTEIEDPVVAKDIIDLEQKIYAFHNKKIDEEKFRSLRLARGVYGQRQKGVQMIRIKLPLGKFTAKQLLRIAAVSDSYANGNLHITTRQDIQLHYVPLDSTPELWAELEKDKITLREACGNTVRNVTASVFAGIDSEEAFDVTPYAHAFFEYFLRNPICQDMGRKFKVAFSSSQRDHAFTFIHDLGFIPKIKNGERGFSVFLGGGLGAQPMEAKRIYDFLKTDKIIPFSEAVLRVFDRYGERNRRNKARLKFLISEVGLDNFLKWVTREQKGIPFDSYPIAPHERIVNDSKYLGAGVRNLETAAYKSWRKINLFKQKQEGYYAVGIPIDSGDFSSENARAMSGIIEQFTKDDNRFTPGQSILLRDVKESHLPELYLALKAMNFHRTGFHKMNDIVACPGTDTCNLGIASSVGLAKVLQKVIESEFQSLIEKFHLNIKISGCMNACGQHNLAHIGFQGMTINAKGTIIPATQILLGGGVLGNGSGRFADKILKVPAKRTPKVLRWILNDFKNNRKSREDFFTYYDRKTKDYFYQNLKCFNTTDNLTDSDLIDWGAAEKYKKEIGIGECAGVKIDLVQTLLFDAHESLVWANEAFLENRFSDAVYHAYNAIIRGAKALLTRTQAKINSHSSIIASFDGHFPEYHSENECSFKESILTIHELTPNSLNAKDYVEKARSILLWIEKKCHVNEH